MYLGGNFLFVRCLYVEELTVSNPTSVVDVQSRLKALISNKATGPDLPQNWILNNFSMKISESVTISLNASH